MQSAVQSGDNSVGATITQWIWCAFDDNFAAQMVERDDKVALVAFQELLLCFRKAHDDGIGLADSIVARIDVLIVTVCSVEVRDMIQFLAHN
jgi:hypothetical protein